MDVIDQMLKLGTQEDLNYGTVKYVLRQET